jgi:aldose 1-epimerase
MLETVSIQDSVSGAAAEFLPGRGMTCCSATLAAGVELVEVIWCPDGFREAGARASSGGIPILCPYPGRLASTRMEFEGRVFELEPADPLGRPIHGFAHDRPWQVIDRTESSVTASFRLSRDAPERLRRWPADFELTAEWTITESQLVGLLRLTANDRMPAAVGLHPYLPMPLRASGDAEACLLDVPATLWQPQQDLLPVGPLRAASQRAPFPGRMPLAGSSLDDAFTGLEPAQAGDEAEADVVTALIDQAAGLAAEVRFDPVFSTCVLFTPPHRNAVCIEPYTVLPGAASFDASRGWQVLNAGESLTAMVRFRLVSLPPGA